jgi:hypothetical protein
VNPRGSGYKSAEAEDATAVSQHAEVAPRQYVHSEQGFELKAVRQFEPENLLEDEWKGGG